jgi:hypothetical protein
MHTKARLSAEEEQARQKAFDFYRYVGKVDAEASKLAWADIQKQFPRLREYEGMLAPKED